MLFSDTTTDILSKHAGYTIEYECVQCGYTTPIHRLSNIHCKTNGHGKVNVKVNKINAHQ